MKLNQGQRNYLLELLNYEYVISPEYYPSLAQAIGRYATADYTNDEIDFLLQTPQSPVATLMLNTTNNLQVFARHYALWLNCLEQNIYENNHLVESILINPDPTSKARLLQVIRHENENENQYQIIPASEIIYTNHPRPQETPFTAYDSDRRLKPTPRISIWDNETAQSLLADFLNFASDSQIFKQSSELLSSPHNYLNQMSANLNRSLSKQLTWQELRSRSRLLPTMNSTYVFADQAQGLIMPSNISFINYLNTQPLKKSLPPKISRPLPQSAPPNRLIQQIRTTLPNIRKKLKPLFFNYHKTNRACPFCFQRPLNCPYAYNRQMPNTSNMEAHCRSDYQVIPQYPNHLNYHPLS